MGPRAAVKLMFESPSPTPHLSGYALFKQTALEFVVFIRPTSTAYMYLYLEGEKVGLEIFLMQFQYIKLDITKHLVDVSTLY